MMLMAVAVLIFAPWVQNVTGAGRVVAMNPTERSQTIDAPVDGRVRRWHVVEGTRVKAGGLVAELMDNDPMVLYRRQEEKLAVSQRLEQGRLRVSNLELSLQQLDATRRNELAANSSRIDMAKAAVSGAEQQIKAGEADLLAARQNLDRRKRSVDLGLSSVRDLEVAEQALRTSQANLDRFQANLRGARTDVLAREADQNRIETSYQRQLQDARAAMASAQGDVSNIMAELQRQEVNVARQATQNVVAPRDGVIFRLLAQPGSELVKAGEPVAVMVPDSTALVVELLVDGNDVPLIHTGDLVRLQFEGWPAIQFSGWPSVAVGSFGGRVFLIDQTDDGKGKFRILVEPDPKDQPWPSKRYLRQGVRANGWVLLKQVPLGFELWRQLNGFPPSVDVREPVSPVPMKKAG
jgi:multidrug efflux pump subunit AcrA (membrane-fusion protein)